MTNRDRVLNYLESEVRFRERKNKNRGIVNLLQEKYPLLRSIPKEILEDALNDNNSMDRAWRGILEVTEALQGKDYNDKKKLEQEYQLKQGYYPGYEQDVRKLKNYERTI